jgi:hypothetical protein
MNRISLTPANELDPQPLTRFTNKPYNVVLSPWASSHYTNIEALALRTARRNFCLRKHAETKMSWASEVKLVQLVAQLLAARNFLQRNSMCEANGIPCSVYHHYGCATMLLLQEDLTSQNWVLRVVGQTVLFPRKLPQNYLGRELCISLATKNFDIL